ncbi:MAG: cysteine dioxygenase family protein [Wenzhouxiangella sp.]|nr:cysteine dioxygenase family protein [Wenzhouxiangella sp.]
MSLEFSGKQILIEHVNQAVGAGNPQAITDALRHALCGLVDREDIRLPQCVFDYSTEHYCRRLIHHDDRLGYSIMAMTWAPSQGTPIHDHAGMWCVEAVWHGEIEVHQYELLERQVERFHLERRTVMRTGAGSAGSLIPPHEYHTIANPSATKPAVTLHIYEGSLDRCSTFLPLENDWYLCESRALKLDAA